MSNTKLFLVSLVILSVLTACGGAALADSPAAQGTATPAVTPGPVPSTVAFRDAVRLVSQDVKPAVVQVTNEQVQVNPFTGQSTTPAQAVPLGGTYRHDGAVSLGMNVEVSVVRLV